MESEDNVVNNLRIAVMPFIPNRGTGPELLDLSPEFYTAEEHHGSLAELRLVNRYLGDVRVILKHLSTMAAGRVRDKWTVLDVATGSADIPVAIAGWARKRGIKVCITGVDVNSQAIRIARKMTGEDPMINFAVADGLDLPFREKVSISCFAARRSIISRRKKQSDLSKGFRGSRGKGISLWTCGGAGSHTS